MAGRISQTAAPGSLFKGAKPERKPKPKRDKRPGYLALVRRCPCLACDNDPAGEAAHLRISAPDKRVTGTGIKPDDRWALPLCHGCHMKQHEQGETEFWRDLGLNPILISSELSAARAEIETMRAVIFGARERRK